MKKALLTLAIILSGSCSYAQWSTISGTDNINNTNTGNVGIGTSFPIQKFVIKSPGTLSGSSSTDYDFGITDGAYSPVQLLGLVNTSGHYGLLQVIQGGVGAGNLALQTQGGNVGIGTTTVDRLLTVAGQIGITGNAVGLVFKNTNASNKLWDITPYGNDLTFNETGISTSMIIKSGGTVGIGTSSPNALFDVFGGNIAVSNNLSVGGADGNGLKLFGNLGNPPYRSVDLVPFVPATAPGVDHVGLKIYTTNGGTARVNAMTISDLGNVIIGNSTQINTVYKLDVYGSVRANSIVVNTTGADFVFENKYKLPQLSEVKSYINQNHHLPEIPSTDEMKKNGMDVAELNKKLLQKVEELTLYLINKDQQDKEKDAKIEQQQNLLKQQQEKSSKQDERISALEAVLRKLTSK